MEGLLDSVRHLTRELRLQMLIIDSFVPVEYQDLVENHVQWNEEIGTLIYLSFFKGLSLPAF